jgi:hypothetical protein
MFKSFTIILLKNNLFTQELHHQDYIHQTGAIKISLNFN